MRLLILGGTTEATALAGAIADRRDLSPTLSLAGRTGRPARPSIPFRIGGFGGATGLQSYLERETIDVVVDATHPFAAQISAHAVLACGATGTPLVRFSRPPWARQSGDRWHIVPDLDAAAAALGDRSRRVFLTTGRLDLSAFKRAPQHRYVIRSIDPPLEADLPPDAEVILARGPFHQQDEEQLLLRHRCEILVSKNSGGHAGRAKINAARALGLEVVMVDRPPLEAGESPLTSLDAVLEWIGLHQRALSSGREGTVPQ